ncbi:hypothetical protein D1007_49094 [Hordeum vulgare]|nr:hypothetical protein D1007_49094 [Hordeum vulgare]
MMILLLGVKDLNMLPEKNMKIFKEEICHTVDQGVRPCSELKISMAYNHKKTPNMQMENYILNEREHYEDVLGGPLLMELVQMMNMPIPEIKVNKRKYGFWGVRTNVFVRKEDPKTEDINYGTLANDCDMGMNTVVHDAIARLSYRHCVELGTHYFGRI